MGNLNVLQERKEETTPIYDNVEVVNELSNQKIENLDDLGRKIIGFVLSQVCDVEDKESSEQAYTKLDRELHSLFWGLSLQGYQLEKK